jgi:hypothetical protein
MNAILSIYFAGRGGRVSESAPVLRAGLRPTLPLYLADSLTRPPRLAAAGGMDGCARSPSSARAGATLQDNNAQREFA